MGAIEDAILAVPEERLYVAFGSIVAGLYAVYLSLQTALDLHVSAAFGGGVIILGIVMLTPHSHLVDSLLEPMLGAGGLAMVLPYLQVVLGDGFGAANSAVVGMLAFGVLLLSMSLVSLVYTQEEE